MRAWRFTAGFGIGFLGLLAFGLTRGTEAQGPSPLSSQSQEEADRKSAGCVSCHTDTDAKSMHASPSVRLGCTDCHGGDASVKGTGASDTAAKERAHVVGLLTEMRENAMLELDAGPQEQWVHKYRGIINNYIARQGHDFSSLSKAYDAKTRKN